MRPTVWVTAAATCFLMLNANALIAQQAAPPSPPPQQPQQPRPYFVGQPLGLPINPAADQTFKPMSPNVKVYGAVYSAESCSYDPVRRLIVVPNRGVGQNVQVNNGWVSLVNPDGSVHTPYWIGVQAPGNQRAALTPPLVLNEPFGSDIINGVLHLSDRDGGTGPNDPSVAVIRRFLMATGAPAGETKVEGAPWFNDIEVAADGTVYASQTPTSEVWRITPDGKSAVFISGAPLRGPNGIAFDSQGNIVIVNMQSTEVLTFSPEGKLLRTENAVQAANDGLVIMEDGTKYISSVFNGGVSRIRPGQPAELIAENIPNAASMCYDAGARQLVIPLSNSNALAFIKLP